MKTLNSALLSKTELGFRIPVEVSVRDVVLPQINHLVWNVGDWNAPLKFALLIR